jgi:hypothetical protein
MSLAESFLALPCLYIRVGHNIALGDSQRGAFHELTSSVVARALQAGPIPPPQSSVTNSPHHPTRALELRGSGLCLHTVVTTYLVTIRQSYCSLVQSPYLLRYSL